MKQMKMGNSKSGNSSSLTKVTKQDWAILELKKQRDKLKQYQKKTHANLVKDKELAKLLIRDGKKDRAKLLLRKKRFQESMLEKSDGQLNNIMEMCQTLEFALIEVKVFDTLKSANEVLKKIHNIMSIDEIEKILEETHEGVEKQNDIVEVIRDSLSPVELQEVETELKNIEEEERIQTASNTQFLHDSEILSLPEVPRAPLITKEKQYAQMEQQ